MSFVKTLLFGHTPPAEALAQRAYDFSFTTMNEELLPLSRYEGKVLLVVNTASECGFTRQYAGLQSLWERYKHRGLVIIAVPSNNFGNQEPGTNQEIKQFCRKRYRVDFPLVQKELVTGPHAHPFYHWAADVLGDIAVPRWNFHKYLIDTEGQLVDFFLPFTSPTSHKLVQRIESLLPTESV